MQTTMDDEFLSTVLNATVDITARRRVTGGSINQCEILTLSNGRTIFLKTPSGKTIPGMYKVESMGLELLAQPGYLQVPLPIYYDEDILLTEAFSAGEPAPNWQEQMGRGLALLHQSTQQLRFGFDCDNFLGTTPQPNTWQENWLIFWRKQRLGFQFNLLREKVDKEDALLVLGEKLLNRLDQILTCDAEKAVLLHGDLWSGNAAANEKGEPVIFDPASYYGNREAEFGMMRLFGGFSRECEDAYQEVWSFQDDYERRFVVYRLYHQLNHLNLFGGSYYAGCLTTIRELL